MIDLTNHSRQRCAQRGIDERAIAFVLRYGQKIHRTGVTFYFLGQRDIPDAYRRDDRYAKLEGTTLLISPEGGLITTYRNRRASRVIRKKVKYRIIKNLHK
jgi:hypothetical protein